MFREYFQADLGRYESASLGGGRRFANLAIGLESEMFLIGPVMPRDPNHARPEGWGLRCLSPVNRPRVCA